MSGIVSIPSDRCFIQIDMHLLGLEIFVDTVDSQFPSKPRLLEPAPRGFHVGGLHVIDPDDSSADCFDNAQGAIDVTGPDGRGQAEGSVVGDAECLALVVEGDDSSHGSENFFARDAGGVVDIVKNSWLDVVAAAEGSRPAATEG